MPWKLHVVFQKDSKNFRLVFEKPLDKHSKLWYNNHER